MEFLMGTQLLGGAMETDEGPHMTIFLSSMVRPNIQYGSLCLARKSHSIHHGLALHDLVDGVNHALGGRQVGAMSRGQLEGLHRASRLFHAFDKALLVVQRHRHVRRAG